MTREKIALASVLCLALLLRVLGTSYALPELYNGDEGQLVSAAVKFGSGDLNPHSFIYPTLFKYLLFISYGVYFLTGKIVGIFSGVSDYRLSYFVDPTGFYVTGRLLSAFFGVLSVWIVFHIGKLIRDWRTGIVAASLLATDFLAMMYSHWVLPDITMSALFLASVFFTIKGYQSGIPRHFYLAAAFAGLAASAKYNAVFCAGALFAGILLAILKREKPRFIISDIKVFFLSGSLVGLFFLIGSPYALLDFRSFIADLSFQNTVISQERSLLQLPGTLYHYFRTLFFPETFNLVGVICLLGLFWALIRRETTILLILGLSIVHLVFFASKTSVDFLKPHYMLPIIPLVYLVAAVSLVELFSRFNPRVSAIGVPVALMLLLSEPAVSAFRMDYAWMHPDTTTLARQWVEKNIPPDSKIIFLNSEGLRLNPNLACLERKGADDQVYEKRQAAKMQASTYDIYYLYQGWSFIPKDKLSEIAHLPFGVTLVSSKKMSFDHWNALGIEYAILRRAPGRFQAWLDRQEPEMVEVIQAFLENSTPLKKFVPDYPGRPGDEVIILKVNHRSETN